MLESKLINFIKIIEKQIEQKRKISIVFIHDGVIGTSSMNKTTQSMRELLNLPVTSYSLLPDLNARGIDTTKLQDKIVGIEYNDLVDILIANPKIVSWM
jgi:sulfur relay protein TusB/DsrH